MISEDDAARLYVIVGRLVRLLRAAGPGGLGPGSVSTLATLDRHGAMRLGDLATREGVQPPTLTRIVATLEAEGYVSRRPDPADGRAWLVSVTPAGRDVALGLRSARVHLLAERIAALDPGQQEVLLAALPVLEELTV